MKIVYLILASNDQIHQRDADYQHLTWARNRNSNTSVIWLRGGGEFKFWNDTLQVPIEEAYANILEKTVLGIRWLTENEEFDYLIRTNVSTYFDQSAVEKILGRLEPGQKYAGGYYEYAKNVYLGSLPENRFISGTGIFMSKKTCELLSHMPTDNYTNIPDDVAITNFLSSKDCNFFYVPRGNLGYTHFFTPKAFIRLKSSRDSFAASNRFLLVHAYFIASNWKSRIRALINLYSYEISLSKKDLSGFLDFSMRLFGAAKSGCRNLRYGISNER